MTTDNALSEVRPRDPGPSSDETGLLDWAAAAAYLSTSEFHVRRLWQERRLAACRVGKFVRFARADLDAFIAAHRVEAVR